MDSILIVGCGYLGRRLAETLVAEGRTVLATTRQEKRADEFRAAGITPVLCDVTEADSLRALPAVATCVYCIGLDRAAGKSMRTVYVEGLQAFMRELPRPARFLYVSSTSVYGQADGSEVDESAATEPVEESGRVVLEAEQALLGVHPHAIRLRFTGIYGPGRLLRAQTLRSGEPIVGDPERWLNLIHVDDGVQAVRAAEQHGQPGAVYNVSDNRPVQRRAFYAKLSELLSAPTPQFVRPPENVVLPHELAHRRISNRRMREQLHVELRYPDFETGLPAACAATG